MRYGQLEYYREGVDVKESGDGRAGWKQTVNTNTRAITSEDCQMSQPRLHLQYQCIANHSTQSLRRLGCQDEYRDKSAERYLNYA